MSVLHLIASGQASKQAGRQNIHHPVYNVKAIVREITMADGLSNNEHFSYQPYHRDRVERSVGGVPFYWRLADMCTSNQPLSHNNHHQSSSALWVCWRCASIKAQRRYQGTMMRTTTTTTNGIIDKINMS